MPRRQGLPSNRARSDLVKQERDNLFLGEEFEVGGGGKVPSAIPVFYDLVLVRFGRAVMSVHFRSIDSAVYSVPEAIVGTVLELGRLERIGAGPAVSNPRRRLRRLTREMT